MTNNNGWALDKCFKEIHWWTASATKTIGTIIPGIIIAYNIKSAIEIGIANGFTTQILSRGLDANGGGKLYSCDINEFACILSKNFIDNNTVEHTTICGDSTTLDWTKYTDSIDLCFIDGDHSYETCKKDIIQCLKLSPKIIILHDFFVHQQGVIDAGNEMLSDWERFVIPERLDTGDYGVAIFQRPK